MILTGLPLAADGPSHPSGYERTALRSRRPRATHNRKRGPFNPNGHRTIAHSGWGARERPSPASPRPHIWGAHTANALRTAAGTAREATSRSELVKDDSRVEHDVVTDRAERDAKRFDRSATGAFGGGQTAISPRFPGPSGRTDGRNLPHTGRHRPAGTDASAADGQNGWKVTRVQTRAYTRGTY